jgi:hypothetical protein
MQNTFAKNLCNPSAGPGCALIDISQRHSSSDQR